jgi:hypothetical protein
MVGFTVYFKIDGVVANNTRHAGPGGTSGGISSINPTGLMQYYEHRHGSMYAGAASIWLRGGGNGTANSSVACAGNLALGLDRSDRQLSAHSACS